MIKKIIIILQILMLIMPTMSVLANNINIGDEIQVERGPLGFYTIQYWDVTRDEWMYVIYSQTYYTDKDGSKKIAYCVNPDLSGVGWVNGEDESYSTKVEYKLTDERIQRVLENGYPYVSYTRLGVETEEDGYLATKQAIYWIIRNRKLENIYDYFRPGQTQINGQNLEDTQRRGTKVIDAIYKLVNIGYNGTTKDKNVDKPEFTELSEFKQDRYNYQFYSKEYRVEKAKSEIKIIGTSLEGMKVVDMNGRTKTTLKAGDRFKVMVPQAKIDTDMEIDIKYESVETTYPVYYTTSNVEGRQNYIIVQNKEELVQRNLKFDVKGNLSTLESVMENPNFRFVKESITDREAVYKLFEEEHPDMVVNFAAESHVDRSIENPEVFLDTNIKGTAVLMDACRKYGIKRYHQVSTDEVYGDLPLDRPDLFFTEETPIHTSSPYSSSKAGADLLVLAYHRTYGLPVTISRCSNNYGPYHFPEKLIPLMIANALNDKPLPVYGKGENVRDWLYVEDHCKAIDLIIHNGRVGEVYNIGGHNEMKNIDIVKIICKELGKPESLITYVTDRKGHDMRYAIDPTKIHNELGWLPETKFADGIKKTIQWYLDNKEWWENIISGEYQNYYEKMYGNR